MKESTKKMWMNVLSTALGVALGFGVYTVVNNKVLTKSSDS